MRTSCRLTTMRRTRDNASTRCCSHHVNDVHACKADTSTMTTRTTHQTCSQHSYARADSLAACKRNAHLRSSAKRTLRRIAGALAASYCSCMHASRRSFEQAEIELSWRCTPCERDYHRKKYKKDTTADQRALSRERQRRYRERKKQASS